MKSNPRRQACDHRKGPTMDDAFSTIATISSLPQTNTTASKKAPSSIILAATSSGMPSTLQSMRSSTGSLGR